MPIVSLKSNLAQIKELNPTPEKTTPNLETVDYFTNTNSQGFTTSRNGQTNTEFKIGTQNKQNFRDSRGNVEIEFNSVNKYPLTNYLSPSRLLKAHTEDKFLENYYNQVDNDNSRFGLRTTNRFGFNQPFIVRKIDNRWGIDNLPSGTFGDIFNVGKSFIDDVGNIILGRSPNEYVGNAIGNLTRTVKFLGTGRGVAFLAKQNILARRNAQKERTDVRYGIGTDLSLESNRNTSNLGDLTKRFTNVRSYNENSLGSLPGVAHISIYKQGDQIVNAVKDSYRNEIKKIITQEAIEAASEVKTRGVDFLKNVKNIKLGKGKLNLGSKLSKFKENFVTTANKNRVVQSVSETLKDNEQTVGRIRKVAEAVGKSAKSVLDKATKIDIDKEAFSAVGRDKVNLIPYGSDKYLNQSYKELDFCPFKFYDVNNNKSIVFRAILSGITDTFSPDYSPERYIGRPDSVYVYQGTGREISFTFDIYPKSDKELVTLWEKMNYLAGLTYPSYANATGGGQSMVSPFCKLTIGDMYKDTSGYISGLTYTVQDNGTWETTFAKLPKYIQASVTFVYIGDRLPSSTQKHYELPWVPKEERALITADSLLRQTEELNRFGLGIKVDSNALDTPLIKKFIK